MALEELLPSISVILGRAIDLAPPNPLIAPELRQSYWERFSLTPLTLNMLLTNRLEIQ